MFDYTEMIPKLGIPAYLCAAVLGVAIFAAAGGADAPRRATEDQMLIFRSPIDDTLWLEYTIGGSVHHIRGSAISSIIWTADGQRNVISYAGGSLQNNISLSEYEAEVKRFVAEDK